MLINISGCGFHLRGTTGNYKFPFKSAIIECDNIAICDNFKNTVHSQNLTQIITSPMKSEITIKIFNEKTDKTAQGYNIAGRISNYTLTYEVDAQILKNHEQIGKTIHVKTFSTVNYNDSQILAANQDEVSGWGNIHKNAIRDLIGRIIFFKTNPINLNNEPNTK